MEEVLKAFSNLPDSDKLRFREAISQLSKPKTTSSAPREGHSETSFDSLKSNFNILPEHLKSGTKEEVEQNTNVGKSPTAKSGGKQKALDGRLIKKNKVTSSSKKEFGNNAEASSANIIIESQSAVSLQNITSNSEQLQNYCSPKTSVSNNDEKIIESSGSAHKEVIASDDNLKTSPNNIESSNNPRKSKRKYTNWSYVKKSKLNEKIKNTEDQSGQLLQDLSSVVNNSSIKIQAEINPLQPFEKNSNKLCKTNSPNRCKTYNLQAKQKLTEKLQDVIISENFTPPVSNHQSLISTDHNMAVDDVSCTVNSSDPYYEAFCRISTKCNQIGLDVHDIFINESVQKLLSNYKDDSLSDAVIFIGNYKSDSGKICPAVHAHSSKSKLIECLCDIQKYLKKKS